MAMLTPEMESNNSVVKSMNLLLLKHDSIGPVIMPESIPVMNYGYYSVGSDGGARGVSDTGLWVYATNVNEFRDHPDFYYRFPAIQFVTDNMTHSIDNLLITLEGESLRFEGEGAF